MILCSILLLDTCLMRCCEEKKLPIDCLEEEFETKQVSQVNGTHHVIRIVRSEKCADYSSIMTECKSMCLGSMKTDFCYI